MSTVTISGTFKNSNNNNIVIEVYSPNPNGYDFKKDYPNSFSKKLDDLQPGETYYIDFTGHTTGSLDLAISGDTDDGVAQSYANFFIDGLTFKTK
jgi:hypothetical protein